jgi:hypothetical protein
MYPLYNNNTIIKENFKKEKNKLAVLELDSKPQGHQKLPVRLFLVSSNRN